MAVTLTDRDCSIAAPDGARTMAAKNKCLALMNKSGTAGKATKGREKSRKPG